MELTAYSPPVQRQQYENLDPVPDRERRELLARARSGDFASFAGLYAFYAARVLAYVHFNIPDEPVADRLAGRVLLNAWRDVACYDVDREPFGVWLYLIARRTLLDFSRSRQDAAPVKEILSPADEGLDIYGSAEPCSGRRREMKSRPEGG